MRANAVVAPVVVGISVLHGEKHLPAPIGARPAECLDVEIDGRGRVAWAMPNQHRVKIVDRGVTLYVGGVPETAGPAKSDFARAICLLGLKLAKIGVKRPR